jgi:hypothetical protein
MPPPNQRFRQSKNVTQRDKGAKFLRNVAVLSNFFVCFVRFVVQIFSQSLAKVTYYQ